MIPLPGGITSTFLNACLVHSMKWKRSSLRRSSIARFFSNASGSKPPHSTASEWSTISCVGTTGLTCAGSPPCSAMASRRPARSTSAVWPRMSWQTTRAGNHGKSRSRRRSISCVSEAREHGRVAAAHEVLGVHARGVGQLGPGAGLRAPRRRRGRRNNRARCRAGSCGIGRSWQRTVFSGRFVRSGTKAQVFRAGVVGARADDLVVDALLDDVRGPAGRCAR